MDYKEVIFSINSGEEYQADILIDTLSFIGFDTFEQTENGFKAYIPLNEFDLDKLEASVSDFKNQFSFSFLINEIAHQNWNEIWESNFEPLKIKDCYVRATFHAAQPDYKYEIIIDPKMAFGTGHHQTTSTMMELMMAENFKEKQVLDMGCGTGILAILASKLGAKSVVAIDYDPVCFESTIENSTLNNITNIVALCGSKESIPDQKFNIILANINRNILLDQLDSYSSVLNENGLIFLSGFYEEIDLDMLKEKAESLGLKYVKHQKSNDWVATKFTNEA
ncbi:MAG: prmA [Sphingobacteriales bacterium]|nr:prmA [Sphingobacteriales bacterium]